MFRFFPYHKSSGDPLKSTVHSLTSGFALTAPRGSKTIVYPWKPTNQRDDCTVICVCNYRSTGSCDSNWSYLFLMWRNKKVQVPTVWHCQANVEERCEEIVFDRPMDTQGSLHMKTTLSHDSKPKVEQSSTYVIAYMLIVTYANNIQY